MRPHPRGWIGAVVVGLVALGAGIPAAAREENTDGSFVEPDPDATPIFESRLAVKQSGGISYVSGGVGKDERVALAELAKTMSLEVTLGAGPTGEFMSGVVLTITKEGGGKVLEATSEGPIFLAKLAPGKYVVAAAEPGGATKTATVSVGASGLTRASFRF